LASSELLLAIDNSIDFLSLALAADGSQIEERHGRAVRPSSEILSLKVAALLHDHGLHLSDLSMVAVSLGPGSFTGIRVALAYAKGVSTGLGLPLLGVPTLDLLAWPFTGTTSSYICPVIDAKKGEVFFAQYRHEGGALRSTGECQAVKPEELAERLLRPCIVLGTGVSLCEPFLTELEGITIVKDRHQRVTGESLIEIGWERRHQVPPEAIRPIYGRKSEAEIKFRVTVT
jgi:tRNA threonylcarbamoyladenosine biosynthesis protein TsaB